jgi:hypothetical protein
MCQRGVLERSTVARPRWSLLYGVVASPLAALLIVEAATPSAVARTVLRCALALATFVGMAAWVWSSRAALDLQDWCSCAAATISVRVIESERPPAAVVPAPLDPPPVWSPEERELVHH